MTAFAGWKRDFGKIGRGQCNVDFLNSKDKFAPSNKDYSNRCKSAVAGRRQQTATYRHAHQKE
jgi:hypothetical protein